MRRGDVVRVQLPRPQGKTGGEQFGTRPAVVVQTAKTWANHSTVVVVPLTSTLSAIGLEGTFLVHPNRENGLTLDSIVLTHQVRAIDKSRIESTIGRLSATDLETLEKKLREILGL